jgi:1-pyrroline-5-carboxylate dehydrogenase
MIINGQERAGSGTFDVYAPADHTVLIGKFQKGTKQDVDDAVVAARAAFPAWSKRRYQERVAILKRAAELIRERKIRLASLLIWECGKNRAESIGEIEEGGDLVEEYANQVELNNGFERMLESLDPAENNRSILRPFGVFAVLAPFNFPHALSAGMSAGAMAAGNTVVYKPASLTPLAGYELARCFIDAGVPEGVFNYVTGGGAEVGEPLAMHPDVDGVAFTGSKEVGLKLYKEVSVNYAKPCLTEMGGKNPTIVTKNADLDKAVEGVARSAFGFSGQKCSACSRVYVEKPVYDDFISRLAKKTQELVVGDPQNRDVFVGPVIDDKAVKRFEQALDSAKGGNVRAGGKRLSGGVYENGTYVAPTVVDGLPLDHELFYNELFLPFIVVGAVDSLDEAIERSNDSEYGLTAGIFTEDKGEIQHFFDNIEAGVIYANRKGGSTTGAWPRCQSFCGWKGSGSTGKGGLGPYYVSQFLREQSRTIVVYDDNEKTVGE